MLPNRLRVFHGFVIIAQPSLFVNSFFHFIFIFFGCAIYIFQAVYRFKRANAVRCPLLKRQAPDFLLIRFFINSAVGADGGVDGYILKM